MKTAIIGLGPHGKRLLEACQRIKTIEEIAIVDSNPLVINELTISSKFVDFEKMLNEFQPELLIISTNGPSHFSIAEKAIMKGVKKLLITKPLTCSLMDGINLSNLAIERKVKIAVDHGLRFDSTYKWLKQNIKTKNWGELLQINIMRNGIGLGCLATHSFDLSNYLFDVKPLNVTAWLDKPYSKNPRGEQFVDPGGLVVLDYGNDKRAVISQIELASGPMIVQLFFEFTRVIVDVKYGTLEVVSKERGGKATPGNPIKTFKEINPHSQTVDHDPIQLMESIILDLINEKDLTADIKHGLSAVEILVASYESAENNNMPINLPLTNKDYINKFLPVT